MLLMRRWCVLSDMALEGSGRYVAYEKSRRLVYISARVADDSAFPFHAGDELTIRIDPKAGRLIVEKA